MFKAIKNNKIIAINETGNFMCLVFDEIIQDKEHTVEDYTQYNGEYVLKADVPAPTNDEQSIKREQAYTVEVDPITSHIQRLRDDDPESPEIAELLKKRAIKVAEIKERYPYFTE